MNAGLIGYPTIGASTTLLALGIISDAAGRARRIARGEENDA
jgi:hypothetical protein